jgi:hypothetical protein
MIGAEPVWSLSLRLSGSNSQWLLGREARAAGVGGGRFAGLVDADKEVALEARDGDGRDIAQCATEGGGGAGALGEFFGDIAPFEGEHEAVRAHEGEAVFQQDRQTCHGPCEDDVDVAPERRVVRGFLGAEVECGDVITATRGRTIASGKPGKPAPLPTSSTRTVESIATSPPIRRT